VRVELYCVIKTDMKLFKIMELLYFLLNEFIQMIDCCYPFDFDFTSSIAV